jgi:hypothetical protein
VCKAHNTEISHLSNSYPYDVKQTILVPVFPKSFPIPHSLPGATGQERNTISEAGHITTLRNVLLLSENVLVSIFLKTHPQSNLHFPK